MNIQVVEMGCFESAISNHKMYFVNGDDNRIINIIVYDELTRENAIKKAEKYIIQEYGVDGWYLDKCC